MKMTMRTRMIIAALMLMVSMGMDAQIRVGYQTDSAKIAEYRERIGIDMMVPDFETKKIDAKVMGTHLATIHSCSRIPKICYLSCSATIKTTE